jgi:hypothetical protein
LPQQRWTGALLRVSWQLSATRRTDDWLCGTSLLQQLVARPKWSPPDHQTERSDDDHHGNRADGSEVIGPCG